MVNSKLSNDLLKDAHLRGKESSLGHIILIFIFLGISYQSISEINEILYCSFLCTGLNISRFIFTKQHLKNPSLNTYAGILNWLALGTAICWSFMFSVVYLKFGLLNPPTICMFIIVAGISSSAASTLYGQKNILLTFLFLVLIIPGSLMIYTEVVVQEKIFGLLAITYFAFLHSQSNINRKNLISKLELLYLAENETYRIDQLFNNVPGIFCYFEPAGKILVSNKFYLNFSKDFGDQINFYHGLEGDFIERVNSFIKSIDEKQTFEYKFSTLDSEPFYICNIQKLKSTNEIILFMLDTTEYKKREAQIQHSARLIELGEVVSSIAHEINNPLAILSGRVQISKRMLLSKTIDTEKLTSNLEKIHASSARIANLVNEMKSLVCNAKNDSQTNHSFEQHLDSLQQQIKIKAESQNVSFELITKTLDLEVFCAPTHLEQVLINVINNALEAAEMSADKWVKLVIYSNDDFLIFEVVDSGVGITDDLLKKIWNPFFTTKEIGKGTGLGLSISRNIVLQNNGKFYYKKECLNTTFVIELPKLIKNKLAS